MAPPQKTPYRHSLQEFDLSDSSLDPLLLTGSLVEQRFSEDEKLGPAGGSKHNRKKYE